MKPYWKNVGANSVMEIDKDLYISYNPQVEKGETAIVKEEKYYILYGDHRQAYEKIVTSSRRTQYLFEAFLQYFQEHIDEMSFWSDLIKEGEY